MSLARRIAFNTAAQIVGKTASIILGVVAIAMMTRYLGKEGFGNFTTIMAFLQFFSILADFGLTLTTMSMIAVPGTNEREVLGNLLLFRLVSALFFLALAPLTALFFPYTPLIKEGIALATLSFLAVALNQIFVGYYQKELRSHILAIAEVLGRIALVLGIWWGITRGHTLLFLIGIVVAAAWIHMGFNAFILRRRMTTPLRFNPAIWKRIIAISWPIAISIFFNLIYLKADTIILSLFRTQEEVGIYGAPYRALETLVTIPFLFVGLVFPVLIQARAAGDLDRMRRVFQKAFDALALMAFPLVLGTIVVATPLMTLLAGTDFAASGPILQILIIAAGIIFFGTLFGHAIVVAEKQKQMIFGYAVTAAVALAGYFLFIPRYSYWGAAWMTVVAEGMIMLMTGVVAVRSLHLTLRGGTLLRILAASIIMAIAVQLAHDHHVLTRIALGALVYGGALILLRVITKKTMYELTRTTT